MRRCKWTVGLLLAVALVCVLFAAQAGGFSTDEAAQGIAAESVLLLETYDADNKYVCSGSGFVAFDGMTLVTNYHVIKGGAWVLAYDHEKNAYLVTKFIAGDETLDIALMEFLSPTKLTPLPLHAGAAPAYSDKTVAIGYPGGDFTVSTGSVGFLSMDEGKPFLFGSAQTDEGSSGGPLLNDAGEVIGVNTQLWPDIAPYSSAAVDISEVIRLMDAGAGNARISLAEQFARAAGSVTPIPVSTPAPGSAPSTFAQMAPLTLKAITTVDGVTLRWQAVPGADAYVIRRNIEGSGGVETIGTAPAGATYFLDDDAVTAEQTCLYTVCAVIHPTGNPVAISGLIIRTSGFELLKNDQAPKSVWAYAAMSTVYWDPVENAQYYIIYRSDRPDGPYRLYGYSETAYNRDWGAVKGQTYYYKVRAVLAQNKASPLSEAAAMVAAADAPVPPAGPDIDPGCALFICGNTYLYSYEDSPYLFPQLGSSSGWRVITGFTLGLRCKDANGLTVLSKETGAAEYRQSFTCAIGPGDYCYAPVVWLTGFENVTKVTAWVESVTYSDGEQVTLPQYQWAYFGYEAQ